MVKNAKEYWSNNQNSTEFHAPNSHLFRILSYASISIRNANVLEIGCVDNQFSDLLEFKRRGAKVHGIDLQNPRQPFHDEFEICDIGSQKIPFNKTFDLVYLIDVIYYLSETEIKFFINEIKKSLETNGHIVIQLIEKDHFIGELENPISYELSSYIKTHLLKNNFTEKFVYELNHTIKNKNHFGIRETKYLVYQNG